MYRFETYVKEKALKETRSVSYFLEKFRLGCCVQNSRILSMLSINLFLVPFGPTDWNGGWNWKAGTRKLKISKASNGQITLKFYRVISPSQFTQERKFGLQPRLGARFY